MRDKVLQSNVRKLITKNVNKHNAYILFKSKKPETRLEAIPMIQERQVRGLGQDTSSRSAKRLQIRFCL